VVASASEPLIPAFVASGVSYVVYGFTPIFLTAGHFQFVGIATLIVQRSDATIYRSQFGSRTDLPEPQRRGPAPDTKRVARD